MRKGALFILSHKKRDSKKESLKKTLHPWSRVPSLKINFMVKVKTARLYQLSKKDERANTPKKVKNSSRKNLIFNHTCLNRITNEFNGCINIEFLFNHRLVIRYCLRANIKCGCDRINLKPFG